MLYKLVEKTLQEKRDPKYAQFFRQRVNVLFHTTVAENLSFSEAKKQRRGRKDVTVVPMRTHQ